MVVGRSASGYHAANKLKQTYVKRTSSLMAITAGVLFSLVIPKGSEARGALLVRVPERGMRAASKRRVRVVYAKRYRMVATRAVSGRHRAA